MFGPSDDRPPPAMDKHREERGVVTHVSEIPTCCPTLAASAVCLPTRARGAPTVFRMVHDKRLNPSSTSSPAAGSASNQRSYGHTIFRSSQAGPWSSTSWTTASPQQPLPAQTGRQGAFFLEPITTSCSKAAAPCLARLRHAGNRRPTRHHRGERRSQDRAAKARPHQRSVYFQPTASRRVPMGQAWGR